MVSPLAIRLQARLPLSSLTLWSVRKFSWPVGLNVSERYTYQLKQRHIMTYECVVERLGYNAVTLCVLFISYSEMSFQ
jgi:hypothetical protein